jgi:hypothetical protein
VLAIVILAIGGQESLHDPADGVILSFDEQMNVIGHQAVGIEVEREPRFLVGELQEQLAIVVVRSEDELAIVASSDDVVEPSLDFESRLAHCASSLLWEHPNVKCELHFARLTPSSALLLFGDKIIAHSKEGEEWSSIDRSDIFVPHPRMHQRRFVLEPLCEIAPELVPPVLKTSCRRVLASLDDPSAVRLYDKGRN